MRRPVPSHLSAFAALPALLLALGACAPIQSPAGPTGATGLAAPAGSVGQPGLTGPGSADWTRAAASAAPQAGDSYFRQAQDDLARRLTVQPNTGQARNVILFVGDGMGVSTITAARIYQGQEAGLDGESLVTAADALPWAGLVKTYTHDAQTADSAATATAIMTGVKAQNYTLGVQQDAAFGDCASAAGQEATSVFAAAEIAGLSTGIVSTAGVTHATPAAAYAHTPSRLWEADSRMPPAARAAGCRDIALQLVEWSHGDGFEVMMGGGRGFFLPRETADPENTDQTGERADGRNLIEEWAAARPGRAFVWNADDLAALPGGTGQIMGLFERGQMNYESRRAGDIGGEPSIAEMTRTAIEMLGRNPEGFVLLVEGGRIDHAHHAGMAGEALNEAAAFDEAVRVALELTDPGETLILVTADHSHGLVLNGYAPRGNPILGLAAGADGTPARGADGLPYTVLTYATGPGGAVGPEGGAAPRADLTHTEITALDFQQPAVIPMGSAAHAGEDVAVRASGPWAHLLSGTMEQHYLYHVMMHALGLSEPGAAAGQSGSEAP